MSTVNEQQFLNTVTSVQNSTVETDAINEQITDQAVAAMIDALSDALSGSDLAELAEMANGSHLDTETEGPPTDEQVDHFVDSMTKIFDQADDPTHSLSGKELMLQLIAAMQQSQSKEMQASNVVDQAHITSSLENAKQQSEDYKQDLDDMNKHHHWWNKVAKVSKNWVAPAMLMVVGFATENPALIMAGGMMMLMSNTPAVSAMNHAFTGLLNQIPGMPDKVSHAMGAVFTVALITAVTFGAGGVASAEVVTDESLQTATELGNVASEEFSTVEEEGSTSRQFNMKKAKAAGKVGFAMSLSAESSNIAKGLASLVPADDKVAKKIVFATAELITNLIAGYAGFQGMSGMMAKSAEGASALSSISTQITEVLGEGAGKFVEQVGNAAEFVAKNSKVFMGIIMSLSGLATVELSVNQWGIAKTTEDLGVVQGDLALLNSTESMNEEGLDQEGQILKTGISSLLTAEKFVEDSIGKAGNNAAELLAQ